MGSIFRSRDMAFCEVFFQSETAFRCVAALGELGLVQFNDMSSLTAAQRTKFLPEIRRIDEMERQIQFLEKQIEKERIYMPNRIDNPPALLPRDITKLEGKLEELEGKLTEMDIDLSSMKACRLELIERLLSIEKTAPFFTDVNLAQFRHSGNANKELHLLQPSTSQSEVSEDTEDPQDEISTLNFQVGVIPRERVSGFERMVWRIGGNNVFVRTVAVTESLRDPKTGSKLFLNVFITIFEGEMLREKIKAISKAFRARIYPCPDKPEDREQLISSIRPRIDEFDTVLKTAAELRHQLLTTTARDIRMWKVQLQKVKSVYYTMNMLNLDVTKRYFIGHCWVPVEAMKRVEDALKEATNSSNAEDLHVPFIINQILPQASDQVPTYFPSNDLTRPFQSIVDAFSVAKYHEINPALFTVITFPFLFSVMFSDAGHGIMLVLFAFWLIVKRRSLRDEVEKHETFAMIMAGRYVILLMGLFSLYSGFMFNEVFGRSINIFGSRWHSNYSAEYILEHADHFSLRPEHHRDATELPYPFGLDPVWYMASNRMLYTNSMKMKISVIFGVVHMFFGVLLSVGNHLYFRQYASVICEFVPQLLLIVCMFGYMDGLIVYKWIAFDADSSSRAPSLLLSMINMFLLQYPTDTEADQFINSHLKTLQTTLVGICAVAIPWLLLAKPLYLLKKSNQSVCCGKTETLESRTTTPMPVFTRSGQTGLHLSPGSKMGPFLTTASNLEYLELSEVDNPAKFSISPRGSTTSPAKTCGKSPVMKFANLFSNEAINDEQQQPAMSHFRIKSSPLLMKMLGNSDHHAKNPSNDTLMPISPQLKNVPEFNDGSVFSGTLPLSTPHPVLSILDPSISYSSFQPNPLGGGGHCEKLEESLEKKDEGGVAMETFDFSEIFMIQVVNTIEYFLGLISHTASYLRLWALSLAHSELSETFWMMVLRIGFTQSAAGSSVGFLYVAGAFLAWTLLSMAVLIFMESLSAFLHALRLHWVEFQSKFYLGDGRPFQPFTFSNLHFNLS